MSFVLDKMKSALGADTTHSHTHPSGVCSAGLHDDHRFGSFAPKRDGNAIKWYVDGCSYMWAISLALERAKESIWILDWWLSPELYLRRPPSKNEQYRVDRMLQAAAERGVKVNIMVYKEVTQALTLSSAHTKHHLEDLHKNICVFRHPDHLPDVETLESDFFHSIKNVKLNAASASKLPMDALHGLYGVTGGGTVLYWAHHEKMCLVDSVLGFMGGLDLCYGRWDTNEHPTSDVHPTDVNETVFPGQDYNNARIMDFQQVDKWDQNKLDRQNFCRMGWSDIAFNATGPIVEDMKRHFVQRWNFIFDAKYHSRENDRYERLSISGLGEEGHHIGRVGQAAERLREGIKDRIGEGEQKIRELEDEHRRKHHGQLPIGGKVPLQMLRSCDQWSHGVKLEHSIASAYIDTIKNAKHFVYIENQFFITATSPQQEPVANKIGGAIVERILRAARAKEKFKVFVVMPAVPAFAGDLRGDAALGTRAIMKFQYNSISRGGHSIYESIAREGFEPTDYIRFFNLRSYDRINKNSAMKDAEQKTGITYEEARREHDDKHGAGYAGEGEGTQAKQGNTDKLERYQQAAAAGPGGDNWDSVAECYMLNGKDIREVPWNGPPEAEMDAIVSEQLYIHTKLLIADDKFVICGSANLNDRSQLGSHDSEIALFIGDGDQVDCIMNGQPWKGTRFAASLRRQIFRKHLGLIPAQDYQRPDVNFEPINEPNQYDWGSPEDRAVADPLSDEFLSLWHKRAKTNTDAFDKVFHPVPSDHVKNWKEYDEYYEKYFFAEPNKTAIYKTGHVVASGFPNGAEGVRAVKETLSSIKGTLVEMPLLFLKEEDIAKEGLGLNDFTETVYT